MTTESTEHLQLLNELADSKADSQSSLSIWTPTHLDKAIDIQKKGIKDTPSNKDSLDVYSWHIKEEFGKGSFECFCFNDISLTRLHCQLTRKIDFVNNHSADQLGFHIILTGTSNYEFYNRNTKANVQSPQVWTQNGNLGKFRIIIPSDQTLKKISICINKGYLKELYDYHPNNDLLEYLTTSHLALFKPLSYVPTKVFELTKELLELPYNSSKLAQMNLQGQCLTLVSMLLSDGLKDISAQQHHEKSVTKLATLKVKNFLDANPSSNKTIEELARFSGINSCYLKYEFKKLTKLTIHQYRQQAKMQLALQLLGDKQKSLHIIAQQLGFNNTDYFIKVFKAYFDQHPKAFREIADRYVEKP